MRWSAAGLSLLPLAMAQAMRNLEEQSWIQQQMDGTKAHLTYQMRRRLDVLLNATESVECAEELIISYEAFITAHITETLLPFESPFVENLCPRDHHNPSFVYKSAGQMIILYIILAHQDGPQIVRLIEALQDHSTTLSSTSLRSELTHFVVHMDGKVAIPTVLSSYSSRTSNVYIMTEGRVNVTWGGFSVVQATLNAISFAFYLKLPFDRVINLSGATYPLATPRRIRKTLAKHPINQELMFIDPIPNVPNPRAWHYFVECDNKLHRIARLGLPRGLPLRTGSQWFIISRALAQYIVQDYQLVMPYTAYAQHILIADENFFATILKGSPFCHHHLNMNYLYVKFDVWEDEKGSAADKSKCLQPDPSFCGRSPMIVDIDSIPRLMDNSSFLFARKFDSRQNLHVLEEIDRRLGLKKAEEVRQSNVTSSDQIRDQTLINPTSLIEDETCYV